MDRLWMDGLEAQFATLRFYKNPDFAAVIRGADPKRPIELEQTVLRNADCFAWNTTCMHACRHASVTLGADVRLHWSRELLPTANGSGFFYFAEPYPISRLADLRPGNGLKALSWGVVLDQMTDRVGGRANTLWFTAFWAVKEQGALIPGLAWAWPETLSLQDLNEIFAHAQELGPESFKEDRVELTRFFYAACLWLRDRILTTADRPIDRQRRRALTREHQLETPLSSVKIIELRRVEHAPSEGTPEHSPVAWACQWIVRGHWQTYHTKNGPTQKWKFPYPKGPKDKPVRVPTHTVYVVNR